MPDPSNSDQLTHPSYTYRYDAYGNQIETVDPLGHVTKFAFDASGHHRFRTLPEDQVDEDRYDYLGRQTLHIAFEGGVTQYVYDDFGHLAAKRLFANMTAFANGTGTPAETISYTYRSFAATKELSRTALFRLSPIRGRHGKEQRREIVHRETMGRASAVSWSASTV